MKELTSLLIWAVLILAVFGYLWWKGHLRRLAAYLRETREELRKCTWPTWDELKGATVVIGISVILLGGFTVLADLVFNFLVFNVLARMLI
ncbi:MAG: preprotein translocase subunit SecE [Verrucomicrobiae bacterium]|nr:preprotein translocase subunit SecE [Verrucomicrobiae bacterium]MCX7722924.1 preprotein translocase subunit SecE [Verrucomicrobiae bacterium]MDW7980258.1 preprotein translocase subunit SecE [Verrucomicrobiales bacterium]